MKLLTKVQEFKPEYLYELKDKTFSLIYTTDKQNMELVLINTDISISIKNYFEIKSIPTSDWFIGKSETDENFDTTIHLAVYEIGPIDKFPEYFI